MQYDTNDFSFTVFFDPPILWQSCHTFFIHTRHSGIWREVKEENLESEYVQ